MTGDEVPEDRDGFGLAVFGLELKSRANSGEENALSDGSGSEGEVTRGGRSEFVQ